MKQFTFEESKQIYQDAKSKGLNPDEVMNSLVRKGATFEGVDMEAAKKAGIQPNYGQRVVEGFGRAAERLTKGIEESAGQISDGFSDIKRGDIVGGIKDISKGGQRAALRTVGTVAGAAFTPILEAPGIKQGVEAIGEQAVKIPAVEKAVTALSRYAQENPQEAKDIEDAINILTLGGGKAVEAPLIRTAKSSIDDFLKPAVKEVTPVGETFSAKTMQRVARIPKGAQSKFKQVSGEDVGEYLVNRGIYGDQDEIATQLFSRFNQSRNVADDAFAKLPGQYQDGAIKDALDELVARERRVSTPNVESPDLRRAVELQNKHDTVGLTMSETNEAKRLFERNVRTGYFKENNADAIARSTNIDQALRNWQFKQAETLGLDNIAQVNKETQAAKQLLDAMTKEIAGTGGNNMVTLTDFIVLSGAGDPATAIAAYFGKKALGNKKLQSIVAKFFAPDATKAEITAPIGETRFLRLPAGQTKVPTVTKPMNLPSRSQSTVDMAEQEAIQTKLLDKQSKLKLPRKSSSSSSNKAKQKSSFNTGATPKADDLTSSISKAKASGQSFDEWVKGQGEIVYHGTNAKIDKFNLDNLGKAQGFDESGVFFTSDKTRAKSFNPDYIAKPKYKMTDAEKLANEKLGVVDAVVNTKKAVSFSEIENLYKNGTIKTKPKLDGLTRPEQFFDNNRQLVKELKEKTDIPVIKVTAEGETQYLVLKPDAVKTRSQLKAEWDKVK